MVFIFLFDIWWLCIKTWAATWSAGEKPKFMKVIKARGALQHDDFFYLTRALVVVVFLLSVASGRAQFDFGGGSGTNSTPTYTPLGVWSFSDSYGWTSDI